jgi:hypothetical protein
VYPAERLPERYCAGPRTRITGSVPTKRILLAGRRPLLSFDDNILAARDTNGGDLAASRRHQSFF